MNLVETSGFQSFLSVHDPNTDKSWDEVEKRVIKYCVSQGKNPEEKFVNVALALSKYDLNGAPSNWEDEYEHEKTIFDWTKWVVVDRLEGINDTDELEEYKEELDFILKIFNKGLIPDCYSLLEEYFC